MSRPLTLLLPGFLCALPLAAQEPDAVTPEQRDAALAKAMRFVDKELFKLNANGSPRRQYATAVAALAWLLAADRAGDGGKKLPPRKKHLDRLRKELQRYTEEVAREYARDDKRSKKKKSRKPAAGARDPMARFGKPAQYNWPLGVAGIFFAESAARGKARGSSAKALKNIVKVLCAAQQSNGGWGHDDAGRPGLGLPPIRIPKPGGGQLDYPPTLLAASHCALSALGLATKTLKAAKKNGPFLEKGRAYFAAAQNGNGTFPYDPSQKRAARMRGVMSGGIEVARTAGAVFALLAAGAAQDDERVVKALAAIDKNPELVSEGHGSATMALQFGALLARARGERAWQTFRAEFFPRILAKQEPSGAFTCACKHASPGVTCDTKALPGMGAMPGMADYVEQQKVYVTAIHCLVLILDRARPRALPEAPDATGPVTGK